MLDSIVASKSFDFATNIINLCRELSIYKKETVLSKQLLRSGTSIGANVREALKGQSRRDFLSKMYIALKEANEAEYWLELLIATNYLDKQKGKEILEQCREVCKILNSIVKTTRMKK